MSRRCLASWVLVAATTLGPGGLVGCTDEPADVRWRVRTPDAALRSELANVRASVLEGGCAGTVELFTVETAVDRMESAPVRLPPGRFGFVGEGFDAQCNRVAAHCVEADLPLAEETWIEIELARVAPVPACDVAICRDGVCPRPDGECGVCPCANDRCVEDDCVPALAAVDLG